MRLQWGLYILVIFTYFTGCTTEPENIGSVGDQDGFIHKYSEISISGSMEVDYLSSGYYEPQIVGLDDIGQLDYRLRMDLGYPRIEGFLSTYEQTIRRNSNRYGFDWRLILAVMNQESRFRIQAVSHRGAYGLMQIMPGTGMDVSSELGIDSIRQPENNITGGVYYLWRMRAMFSPPDSDRGNTSATEGDILKLALAAYNGGPSRVRDAQRLAVYLGLDPYRWDVIRDLLPMLERRYYTLHRSVWENGRPTGNYFYGWPETINYVDSVMEYYSYYQAMFD
jgi:soluble lytic murein transglycosylase-like protein